jgi:hypothetical protein
MYAGSTCPKRKCSKGIFIFLEGSIREWRRKLTKGDWQLGWKFAALLSTTIFGLLTNILSIDLNSDV